MAPARSRSELIREHGRGKAHTPRLVAPFKVKRNADCTATRKKARITAGDLNSNEKIPGASSATLTGETSRYMTQLGH